jgi:hypothetical protein
MFKSKTKASLAFCTAIVMILSWQVDLAYAQVASVTSSKTTTTHVSQTEPQKIAALIEAIRQLDGASFIRNGTDHTAIEAADHLAMKVKRAGNKIKTAEQFIDRIASQSSMSGKPYQIRMPDGKLISAGDFFRAELAKLK